MRSICGSDAGSSAINYQALLPTSNGFDENKALVTWFIRNVSDENESLLSKPIIKAPRVGVSHFNDVVPYEVEFESI